MSVITEDNSSVLSGISTLHVASDGRRHEDAVDGVDVADSGDNRGVKTSFAYRMDHKRRGTFVIINNKNFDEVTGMTPRAGSDQDAANLYTLTKKLGFDVTLVHDQTTSQMLQYTLKAASADHGDCDCFGMAVLSHGENHGILYGVNGIITVDSLVAPLKKCASLAGKPKIFIIQACRGDDFDAGTLAHDAQTEETKTHRIPLEADFLYAYSTAPGYFSWRNSAKGSWFIQAFYDQMTQNMYTLDLVKILTRVNHQVAYEFESNTALAWKSEKKQIPSIVSMLTKDIQFTPKN